MRRFVFAATVSAIATVHQLNAAATRIAFVDPFATARGNAFTATADNPSAVFYNAAGLTQIEGTAVQGNVFAISLDYEYAGPGGTVEMDDGYQAVPSFFVAHNFKDNPLAVGFGAYAPFALGTDWGAGAPWVAPLSPTPYRAELGYLKYHAVVAWQITDTLSIAVGPTYDTSEIEIQTGGLLYEGNDSDLGFSASLLWQPHEQHSFGLNYQGRTRMNYKGTATFAPVLGGFTFGSTAELDYPESIVVGYSYRPSEKWNFEFNIDWTNWERVNTLTLSGVPGVPPYPLNWESAFIWELGGTRYFDNGWNLSAGYTFVENAVPDATFLPIVPDSDRHFFAIGVGRDYGGFYWQASYQFAYAEERSVNSLYPGASGSYDLDSQAFAFSLGYQF